MVKAYQRYDLAIEKANSFDFPSVSVLDRSSKIRRYCVLSKKKRNFVRHQKRIGKYTYKNRVLNHV